MLQTPIDRFRIMGFIEGASLVILLFFAMPLKYFAGIPEAVSIVGALHGGLFISYVLVIAYTTVKIKWSFVWIASAIIVAFIPFGNMMLDSKLKKQSFFINK
jgi:integral membrane protein